MSSSGAAQCTEDKGGGLCFVPPLLPWMGREGGRPAGQVDKEGRRDLITSCMNLRHTGRISLLRVALNIMTCFSCGVMRKISWTSRRISIKRGKGEKEVRTQRILSSFLLPDLAPINKVIPV